MRTTYIIIIVGLLALIIGLAAGLNERTDISRATLDQAVGRAVRYLASAHQPYHWSDAYLEYVYPGESLTCQAPGCRITYRLLDAYVALTLIEPKLTMAELVPLRAALNERDILLADIVPRWRTTPIYNASASTAEDTGGVALDTYCLVGHLKQERPMAEQALKYYRPEYEWLKDNYYTNDRWRNIADETWCLRLLSVTHVGAERLPSAVDKKIRETREYLITNEPVASKLAALYHTLALLNEVNVSQNNAASDLARQAVELSARAESRSDPMALGNTLDVLSSADWVASSDRDNIARQLLALQQADGSWRISQQTAPVFATIRALAGLTSYRATRP